MVLEDLDRAIFLYDPSFRNLLDEIFLKVHDDFELFFFLVGLYSSLELCSDTESIL
jgi:hypothetical protein